MLLLSDLQLECLKDLKDRDRNLGWVQSCVPIKGKKKNENQCVWSVGVTSMRNRNKGSMLFLKQSWRPHFTHYFHVLLVWMFTDMISELLLVASWCCWYTKAQFIYISGSWTLFMPKKHFWTTNIVLYCCALCMHTHFKCITQSCRQKHDCAHFHV